MLYGNQSEPPCSTKAGLATIPSVLSSYLVDGETYRFRLRAWGGGTPSAWTDYQFATATSDPVAPAVVSCATVTEGVGRAMFEWSAPNSANYYACQIRIGTTNNINSSNLVATEYGPPSAVDNRTVLGLSAWAYYGWLLAINPSGRAAAPVAIGPFTIT